MTEFGHFGYIGNGICLDYWGAGPFVIDVHGKHYRFEDSDRFGPLLLKKKGEPAVNQPTERSPFWKAHHLWKQQGRRVGDDGVTCVYDAPRPTQYRKVGRQRIIVEHGDEGGDYIEVGSVIEASND